MLRREVGGREGPRTMAMSLGFGTSTSESKERPMWVAMEMVKCIAEFWFGGRSGCGGERLSILRFEVEIAQWLE